MPQVCSNDNCSPDECVELTDRESSVCQIICESPGPVSFTQVKASSKLHQQVVSQTVRRLVIHGLVTKEKGRYKGLCKQTLASRL
jgi:DNA-binding HxlR family transcriptional regulator